MSGVFDRRAGDEAAGGRVLRESEERFRKLTEATFEGVAIHEKGVVLTSNDTFAGMFGYEPGEVIGMNAIDFAAPESRGLVLGKSMSLTEESYEAAGLKKDGTRIVVEIRGRASRYRGREVRLSAMRDITELKEKERALRESEERFRTTFEQAAVGMAHVSLDGRWLRVNAKLCETLGYAPERLLSKTFQEMTHPEDLDLDLGERRRLLAGGMDEYSTEKRYIRGDGSTVWAALRVSLVRGGSGEPLYFISIIEDIDERKKAESALLSLTSREREVLKLLGEGCTNPVIARQLAISARTAKFHVQNVVAKLGVADRKQAAERATQLGLPARIP